MPFPIKYNAEERQMMYAQGARSSRHLSEQRGEPYTGSIASPIDESLTVESQDLEVGKEWMEDERNKLQGFMDDYIVAEKMMVFCRRFVHPDLNEITFEDPSDGRTMPMEKLFFQLGLPVEKLQEVYEHGNLAEMYPRCGYERREDPVGFSGHFTENGKQRLADILGKEITFYRRPSSDPVGYDPETFKPTK